MNPPSASETLISVFVAEREKAIELVRDFFCFVGVIPGMGSKARVAGMQARGSSCEGTCCGSTVWVKGYCANHSS